MIRHELSYEVINDIYLAFSEQAYWLAYNAALYYLERGQVLAFGNYDKARAFVEAKVQSDETFKLIRARNIAEVFKQIPYEKNLYNTINVEVMNEKNLEYLKDNLKYAGFGESLQEQLAQGLRNGEPNFQLRFETEMNRKAFAAVLNFRKSDNSELYFFNSYHATLQRSNGEVVDQAFYLNRGKGVTAKEAYNLLEGRAVFKELQNKEGQSYHAWLQLDLGKRDKNNNHEVKQFHENFGFNLEETLRKFPIKELGEADLKEVLLRSLEKGNLQAVSFTREGSVQKMFVEANPQFKSVNIYDGQLKRVKKEDLRQYSGKEAEPSLGKGQQQEGVTESKKVNGSVVEKPKPAKTKSTKRSPGL